MADGVARILYDKDGNELQVLYRDGSYFLRTADDSILELLKSINVQLKKLNRHMESVTNMNVDNMDVSEE